MNKKVVVLVVIALMALLTLFLVYKYVYNKPHADIAGADAEFSLTPEELFEAYNTNYEEAVIKYSGKVIAIYGVPDAYEMFDDFSVAVFLLDEGMFGPRGIRCTFPGNPDEIDFIEGQPVTIKGFCSGYNDEDVILEQCTLIN